MAMSVLIILIISLLLPISVAVGPKTLFTVSPDGTADFRTVSEAVSAIPDRSTAQYTIHIKRGVYVESVYIGPEKLNVVFIGDGMGITVLTFNKSVSSGYQMASTATLETRAFTFIAKDMSIVNSAGSDGGPDLALKSVGDNIAFHRCSIEGYQDTIYIARGRNFFFECAIYGTVDFICGDGNIIFQSSMIYFRRRSTGVVTAESRTSPQDNSGIVIHNCTITASPDARGYKITGYLGRPWRKYSRTVVMQSFLDTVVDKRGWLKWDNHTDFSTLDYREYDNRGPGASTDGRVNWPGYKVIKHRNDALPFTVQNFIRGKEWLPINKIPFIPGLI